MLKLIEETSIYHENNDNNNSQRKSSYKPPSGKNRNGLQSATQNKNINEKSRLTNRGSSLTASGKAPIIGVHKMRSSMSLISAGKKVMSKSSRQMLEISDAQSSRG